MSRAEGPSLPPVTLTVGTEQGCQQQPSLWGTLEPGKATQRIRWRLALPTPYLGYTCPRAFVCSAPATMAAPGDLFLPEGMFLETSGPPGFLLWFLSWAGVWVGSGQLTRSVSHRNPRLITYFLLDKIQTPQRGIKSYRICSHPPLQFLLSLFCISYFMIPLD